MTLKMYVGKLFVDQVEFDTDPALPVSDRQELLEIYARDLFNHWRKGLVTEPTFFIEHGSKMNHLLYKEKDWQEVYDTTPGVKQHLLSAQVNDQDA